MKTNALYVDLQTGKERKENENICEKINRIKFISLIFILTEFRTTSVKTKVTVLFLLFIDPVPALQI